MTAIDVHAVVTYRKVALTGDAVPGTDPGVVYNLFGRPVLNAAGQTAFRGILAGTGVDNTNDIGIWSEGSGSLSLVARAGDAAPGTLAVFASGFFGFTDPVLNSVGQTTFKGDLTGTGVDSTNDSGIWLENSGALGVVAREGNAAPGTTAVFGGLRVPALNPAGQISFGSSLTGPGVNNSNDSGIWSGGSGSLGLVTREDDPAPNTQPGVVYDGFGLPIDIVALNGIGETAFRSSLTGAGVDITNNQGIWLGTGGSQGLVARTGSSAPGTQPGVAFSSLGVPVINDAGQTAFFGFLTGSGVDSSNDRGIWLGSLGSLGLVARKGEAAPGTSVGAVFAAFFNPVLNGSGQAAFRGALIGTGVDSTNNFGIWSQGGGSLSLVARAGETAPGTAAVFRGLGFLDDPVLNLVGQIAFRARLTGLSVDDTNDFGIWATDPNGVLTLIARKGDMFDVNDDPLIDDLRTISLVELTSGSGGEEGRATSFNDNGQLAFVLNFTDGSSGIFVASLGSIALDGDLNADGFVGVDDLNLVLLNWNQNVTPGDLLSGDATGEGFVGVDDLNVLLVNWNNGTPPADGAVIPEPGILAMLGVGLPILLRRRG